LHSHDRLFYKQYLAGGKVSCGTRDPPTSRSDTHYELVATAINGGGGECLTHCEHVAVPKLKILHDPIDSEEKPTFVLVRPLAFGDETSALVCVCE
jgi:hypothetical protein